MTSAPGIARPPELLRGASSVRAVWLAFTLALACHPAEAPAPAEAPVSEHGFALDAPRELAPPALRRLVSSSASGRLDEVYARTAVEGPLTFSELRLVITNPSPDRAIEGQLTLELPIGARVTRLALKVRGEWRESVMVPRTYGEQVYGAIVNRREDPALLRTLSAALEPARLDLRVFPISPGAQRQVLLSVAGFAADLPASVAVRDGERALVRARIDGDDPESIRGPLLVLVDSSASMAPHWRRANKMLEKTLKTLRSRRSAPLEVELVAFDQTLETIYAGPLARLESSHFRQLRARGPLGATDPVAALRALGDRRPGRVVMVTDEGRARSVAELGPALAGLGADRIDLVVAVAPGRLDEFVAPRWAAARPEAAAQPPAEGLASAVDAAALSVMSAAGLRAMTSWEPTALARALAGPVYRDVALSIPGGHAVTPARRPQIHAGAELIALATVPGDEPIQVTLHDASRGRGRTLELESRAGAGPLFDRLWTANMIDAELATSDGAQAKLDALRARALERHALSPLTALLALESRWDERERGVLDRHARAQLVIEGGAVVERTRARERGAGGEEVVHSVREATARPSAPGEVGESHRASRELEGMARRLELLEREGSFDETVRLAELESRALGESRAGRLDRIRRGVEGYVREHGGSPILTRLLVNMTDRTFSIARRECYAGYLRRARSSRSTRWSWAAALGPEERPAPPRGIGAESPAMATQLAGAWLASGEVVQARRAAGSLEDLGASRLDQAAVLSAIPGRGGEARALLELLRGELIAEAQALPEGERPFTRAWAETLARADVESLESRRIQHEMLAIEYLLAASWILEGEPARAVASIEARVPRLGRGFKPSERELYELASGAWGLRRLVDAIRDAPARGRAPGAPSVLVGGYAPDSDGVELAMVNPEGITSGSMSFRNRAVYTSGPLPAAIVAHARAKRRDEPVREPPSWARVDLIETTRDGSLRLTPRFLSLEGRGYAALPMPQRIREYAGCAATP